MASLRNLPPERRLGTHLVRVASRARKSSSPRAQLLLCLCGSVLGALPLNPASAQVVSPGSTVAGKTIGDWIQDWGLWAYREPEATSPMYDATGEFQRLNQAGPVWFVGGTFGGVRNRSFTVPANKYLFTSVILAVVGTTSPTADIETEVRLMADDHDLALFSIDDFTISESELLVDYRAASGRFQFELPSNSIANPTSGYAAFDGTWVMMEPLPPGEHVLHKIGGASVEDFRAESVHVITAVDISTGDSNGDGLVDLQDFAYLKAAFGSGDVFADFDNNGVVDLEDFTILKENFGTSVAVPEPTALALLSAIGCCLVASRSARSRCLSGVHRLQGTPCTAQRKLLPRLRRGR